MALNMANKYKFQLIIILILTIASMAYANEPINRYDQFSDIEIGQIIIDNRNIYDLSSPRYANFPFKTINKLHIKTRKKVIQNELLFQVGDKFSIELARETERNLRLRLSVFDAWIEVEEITDDKLLVTIVTIDQWSLISSFNFTREGNETNYRLTLEERNLFGKNQFVKFDYFLEDVEKDYINIQYLNSRTFNKPFRFNWVLNNSRFNRYNFISISKPFYNLNQNCSYGLSTAIKKSRWDSYVDNQKEAEAFSESETASFAFETRFGEYKKKTKLSFYYDYVNETISDLNEFSKNTVVFPEDSSYHRFGLGITKSSVEFVKLYRIDSYYYPEDFALGSSINISYFRALKQSLNKYYYNIMSTGLNFVSYHKNTLFSFSISNRYWFYKKQSIRNFSSLSLGVYNHYLESFTFAFQGRYQSDWLNSGSNYLLAGGESGLRGFNKFYKTGNRKLIFNLENRFFTGLEILSVYIGTAIFTDIGRIWKSGDEFDLNDFDISVGVGLRLYPERISNNRVVRFDVAYSEFNKWQLSIDSRQYFSAP